MLSKISPFWYIFISILTSFFNALGLNLTFSRFKLLDEINLLPAFIFITLQAMFPGIFLLSPAIFSFAIMLFVLYNLIALFDMERAVQHLFFTAFYLSIAALLFYPVIYFIIFILIAFPMLKRPTWQELIIIPVAALIPLHFVVFYYYWTDQLNEIMNIYSINFSVFRLPTQWKLVKEVIPFTFLFFILVLGFFKDNLFYQNKNVRTIRFIRVFTTYLMICSFIFIFFTESKLAFGYFFLIPVTFFLSLMFTIEDSRLYRISFILLILLAFGMQSFSFFIT